MAPTLPKLKLTHFDARMRGESTRLALHVGNVPFEDERVSYKTVHDPGETWLTMKKTMPFRQMPVMTINGTTQISQSNGILRYAGTLGGLYPAADPLKAALVDQVVLHIDDMNMVIFPSIIERDNNKRHFCAKKSLKRSSQKCSATSTKCWRNTVLANGLSGTPSLLLISAFTC
ncbi:hypothetical protein BASA50_008871 [Batrachochytrium salamandrivorans]|uniref:GST N-terminal domain-containing protein n=1 Tax=Batrachochytrium salamandrivorans TaxID=1357716 RepID=A0ABQ8F259_9FUNG|nr:hypothetical protein BASA50_008871 [Batrachochytrium salamandrivorans]